MKLGAGTIFAWLLFTWTWLALSGCGPGPVEERPVAPAAKTPLPAAEAGAPPIRSDASWQQEPAPDDEGLSGRPAPPLPAGHQGFRDHHVVFYVSDPAAGLENALRTAAATGGQVINYPISGFENLEPDERILVFDARTYQSFLRRLRAQGEAVYSEIGPSDFVTVRLTVKEKK